MLIKVALALNVFIAAYLVTSTYSKSMNFNLMNTKYYTVLRIKSPI